MKKKEWYDLLAKYNELAGEKKFNGILVETECFQNIKEKILQYLIRDALVSATCDAKGLVDSYHREGIASDYASEIYRFRKKDRQLYIFLIVPVKSFILKPATVYQR